MPLLPLIHFNSTLRQKRAEIQDFLKLRHKYLKKGLKK